MTRQESLQRLLEGNSRFVSGMLAHPHQDPSWRQEAAKRQQPFAAILTCSDSRTPPEILFDCGLGDLFVARNAGNVADDVAIASLEFAAARLSVPLILILGHQRCAAVQAALEGRAAGRMAKIAEYLLPAVEIARNQPGDPLDNAARAHAKLACDLLSRISPILKEKISTAEVTIIGAYYGLDQGIVELL